MVMCLGIGGWVPRRSAFERDRTSGRQPLLVQSRRQAEQNATLPICLGSEIFTSEEAGGQSMDYRRHPLLDLVASSDVRRFLAQTGGLRPDHELPDSFREKLARLDAAVAATSKDDQP
jgi:hypothetical protein